MIKLIKEGSGNSRVKQLFDRVNELDYWDDDTYREIWKIAAQTNKDKKFTELMDWYFNNLGKKFDARSGKWLDKESDDYKADMKKYDYIMYNFEKIMDRAARILGYYFDEDNNIYVTKHEKYGKKFRKEHKSLQKESESMMPDYTENGSWCIWYYNEADAEFGHDPGPQIVEDNLTQEYAEARAEELNATCQPFEQYWAERERERHW